MLKWFVFGNSEGLDEDEVIAENRRKVQEVVDNICHVASVMLVVSLNRECRKTGI